MSVTALRSILGRELSPSGTSPERFSGTQVSDRQVLSDVEAAGAGFLITSDVDDFAVRDLVGLSVSAASYRKNPNAPPLVGPAAEANRA
jgi:hypothetical protein